MDRIKYEDLDGFLGANQGWRVSIYMPAHRTGREVQQDPIRLNNLLGEASDLLITLGLRTPDVERFLEPAQGLLSDADFWRHQSDGLALFGTSQKFTSYRLPVEFDKQVVVSKQFIIVPLIPILNGDGRFFILALSQNQVRLYRGSRFEIQEVDSADLPESLARALRFDDPERQLQFHTGTVTPRQKGKRPAVFHGHGVGSDDAKNNLLQFFHQIDEGLRDYLGDSRDPLVLAGVDYLLPIYEEANSYPTLIEPGITGNPEEHRPEELHTQAWPLVSSRFQAIKREALERYFHLNAGNGDLTSNDLHSILPAAHQGRIETLFVAVDQQPWGTIAPDHGYQISEVYEDYRPRAESLLDVAAAQTILNSGRVFALSHDEIPNRRAAAIFRYPLPQG